MTTIRISAARYEDEDDCLQAAAAEALRERPCLQGWDLCARWESEQRDTILLDIPAWALRRPTETAIRDMLDRVGISDPHGDIRVAVESALIADPAVTPAQIREGWKQAGEEARVHAASRKCACACGCVEVATTTDDTGVHVCAECADYYTTDGGDVVCSREQGDDTCRHCSQPIEWGSIQTGQPGVANWRDGRCSCRGWTSTDRGGQWELSEREVRK